MDYVWLAGTAWFTNKGTNLVGTRGYMVLTLIFAGVLIYFGLTFLWSALIISGVLS